VRQVHLIHAELLEALREQGFDAGFGALARAARTSVSRTLELPVDVCRRRARRPVGSAALVLVALLLCYAPTQADEITLDTGATLTITATRYNRRLPHSFYDQAMASLPRLYPEHDLLAGRRFGRLGGVVYSLVCYSESPSGEKVVIEASAVSNGTRSCGHSNG
jgi:hypothetical protein